MSKIVEKLLYKEQLKAIRKGSYNEFLKYSMQKYIFKNRCRKKFFKYPSLRFDL